MRTAAFLIAIVIGLLLAETRLSRDHARRLRARGAVAPDGDVYRTMAVLYPAAFVLMGVEGIWRATIVADAAAGGPSWPASGVVLFAASKALKYWAIRTLGERWTFRVFVLPGRPLVNDGPYRYVAHPNYIAVIGELAGTAMMMTAAFTGPVMLLLFGAALVARIRFENRVHRQYGAV
jgi:methyltransferase